MKLRRLLVLGAVSASLLAALSVSGASAATTVVVTPAHTQGWAPADVRPGGEINFISDASSPYPDGALQLKTDATTAAKAQYLHAATDDLADVTELGYWTKQVSGPPHADASFQLVLDLNGDAPGGFTTMVFEPYQNGVVVPGAWEQWDVDTATANLWSSRSFSEGTCVLVAGSGGPPFYNVPGLQAACPDAVVLAFGVNVGTFNPSYDVETDGVSYNDTIYDFELANEPADKSACKIGGWQNLTRADGSPFKNQGDCIQYVNTGK
jgi:hypothetical protein